MTLVRNRATPEGHQLGVHLARFCDDAEPVARLKAPDIRPRCASCAFRAGPHVQNGSPQTQMDALKCVIERTPFLCHEPAHYGEPCAGWTMMTLAHSDDEPRSVAWPFSDEVGEAA